MEEFTPSELGETGTVEVTVFRDGTIIRRELCESEEDAAAVVDQWSELEGVECQVDDLSVHHRAGEILEPEESVEAGENFPRARPETREALIEERVPGE